MGVSKTVKGSGEIVKEERKSDSFDKIVLNGMGTVILKPGESNAITVETDRNLLEYLITRIENNTLTIEISENVTLLPSEEIHYYVGISNLTNIDVKGAGTVKTLEPLKLDKISLALSGAGSVIFDLDINKIEINLSGSGDIKLSGNGNTQAVIVSGAGTYKGLNFITDTAQITLNGVGNAEVNVKSKLDVEIAGVGSVSYKGSPKLNQSISGVGTVRHLEEK